jgi:hypothetical protein
LEGFLQELNKEAGEVSTRSYMNNNEDAAYALLEALLLGYNEKQRSLYVSLLDRLIWGLRTLGTLFSEWTSCYKRILSNMQYFVHCVTQCRTVARTDLGDLCLVPFWAEPGDLLCQFVWCTVPVISRKNELGDWKYIGECYVYRKPAKEIISIVERAMQSDTRLERFRLV